MSAMTPRIDAQLLRAPVLLKPDNFTPLSRTPWGGHAIGRLYKDKLVHGAGSVRIGESWEFSIGPEFPSKLAEHDGTLAELIASFPEGVLSKERVEKQGRTVTLLVKLLDAMEPLSMQVHPTDDDPALLAGECGKPESWLVLHAEKGAGLYLGFSRAVKKDDLQDALRDGDAAKDLMHFEPVKAGDYFEIEPGVPHAIGPGVTLLEPQRVLPEKSGKTFRMYDWGRRYDPTGALDMVRGAPRPLHVTESVALVRPETQIGARFAATLRRAPKIEQLASGILTQTFPANASYQVHIVSFQKDASATMLIEQGYGALTMLSGELRSGTKVLEKGRTALLPHAAMPLSLSATSGTTCAVIIPQGATFRI